MGLRLLARTTRSVAPTEAANAAKRLGPRFDEIEAELAELSELRDKPAGTIPHHQRRARSGNDPLAAPGEALAALSRHQGRAQHRLWPDRHRRGALRRGVRPATGGKGHDCVRIGPDFRMAVVGAPSYFARRPKPKDPRDLTAHDCINIRLPTYGSIYAWEFEKRGRALKVRVEGRWCSTTSL